MDSYVGRDEIMRIAVDTLNRLVHTTAGFRISRLVEFVSHDLESKRFRQIVSDFSITR